MKRLSILLLLLLTFSCTYYSVRDNSNLEEEESYFLKSKKIGLIGFFPFYETVDFIDNDVDINSLDFKIKNEQHLQLIRFVNENPEKREILTENKNSFVKFSGSKSGIDKTTAWLNKAKPTNQLLEFGENSNKLKSRGVNNSIENDRIKIFLSEYLLRTKHLGLSVIEPLITITNNADNKAISIQMNQYDIDYWVIGYHAPIIKDDSLSWKSLTLIPAILTLGTFPYLSEVQTESTLILFDRNLNLVEKFEYKNNINTITSWWILSDGERFFIDEDIDDSSPPTIIYKPDLSQFSKELSGKLRN